MRATEFLVEYNRAITAQNYGDKLLDAASKDRTVPNDIKMYIKAYRKATMIPDITQSQILQMRNLALNSILADLESKDPTANKQYTQWLARMYMQLTWYMEDLNRNNMLGLYHLAKQRRMIDPNFADINKFKSYAAFEDYMQTLDLDKIEGKSKKAVDQGDPSAQQQIFENDQVKVIVPLTEQEACRIGRGTRWCTAATRGNNLFKNYSDQGPLYVLLPKQPSYNGEKYQIHFPTEQFMDAQDNPVDPKSLLNERFPGLFDVFKKIYPGIDQWLIFTPDKVIANELKKIKQHATEILDNLNLSGLNQRVSRSVKEAFKFIKTVEDVREAKNEMPSAQGVIQTLSDLNWLMFMVADEYLTGYMWTDEMEQTHYNQAIDNLRKVFNLNKIE